MLSWAITFLIIAIIAAVLGFGGIAGAATGIAKILFVLFRSSWSRSSSDAVAASRMPRRKRCDSCVT